VIIGTGMMVMLVAMVALVIIAMAAMATVHLFSASWIVTSWPKRKAR
jgi:hypothetical protein